MTARCAVRPRSTRHFIALPPLHRRERGGEGRGGEGRGGDGKGLVALVPVKDRPNRALQTVLNAKDRKGHPEQLASLAAQISQGLFIASLFVRFNDVDLETHALQPTKTATIALFALVLPMTMMGATCSAHGLVLLAGTAVVPNALIAIVQQTLQAHLNDADSFFHLLGDLLVLLLLFVSDIFARHGANDVIRCAGERNVRTPVQ